VVLNLAIGQGELLVTPIQLATLAATVASRGRVPRPHLVRAVRDAVSGRARPTPAGEGGQVDLPAQDWDWVIGAMERVVAAGTGGMARIPGVRVAGKTGTAQNPHGQDHALFIAFAPVDDPRVAIAVVVENGGHGGSVAAPIAQQAMRAYLAPAGIGPAVAGSGVRAPAALAADTTRIDTTLIKGD
jgi:penicillin-binding protein 2